MAYNSHLRADLSLNDKVKLIDQEIQGKPRINLAYANIELGKNTLEI